MTDESTPPPTQFTAQAPAMPKTPGVAVTSLVLGILSYVCIGPFASIPAVICGHVAMGKIKQANGMLGGHGMALAGIILGYVNIAISLILIPLYLAIALPSYSRARDAAMTNACINNLRIIDSAKDQWAIENSRRTGEVPQAHQLLEYFRFGEFPSAPRAANIPSVRWASPPPAASPDTRCPLTTFRRRHLPVFSPRK